MSHQHTDGTRKSLRQPPLRTFLIAVAALCMHHAGYALAAVVNFDDLGPYELLTGTGYAGLAWEYGNVGQFGQPGYWVTTLDSSNSYPHSPPRAAGNELGCALLGIAFPNPVNMGGAYFAAQGSNHAWSGGIRVHGYLAGFSAGDTDWLMNISTTPQWLDMSELVNVDRIIIESIPTYLGVAGYYGMDDLTYESIPEPAGFALVAVGALALLGKRRHRQMPRKLGRNRSRISWDDPLSVRQYIRDQEKLQRDLDQGELEFE